MSLRGLADCFSESCSPRRMWFGRQAWRRRADVSPRRLGRIAVAASGLLVLTPALAPGASLAAEPAAPPLSYPASGRTEDVLKWTAAATSIKPAKVLAVTPQLVAALERVQPAGEGTVVAVLREEVIDPVFAAQAQGRSMTTNIKLDCPGRRFQFVGEVAYPEPNLKGPPRYTEQRAGWAPVRDGAVVAQLYAAACPRGPVAAQASRLADAGAIATAPAAPRPPAAAPPAPAGAHPAAPAPAAPPTPTPPPPPPAAPGPYVVRVGTFAVASNAQAEAAALGQTLRAGAPRQVVVHATGEGPQRYSLVDVTGFADHAAAAAYCATLPKRLGSCIIRLGRRPRP
jgi:hypothetical protein